LAIASIGTERIAPGTCTRRSSSIQRLIVSASQKGPGVPGVEFQVWRENFLFFEKFSLIRLQKFSVPLPNRNSQREHVD
jgi:hypothetical protein